FFQAEDGIRGLTVTGVQTCALPISSDRGPRSDAFVGCRRTPAHARGKARRPSLSRARRPARGGRGRACPHRESAFVQASCRRFRSEERRVGKEGRVGWTPYRQDKKQ